MRAHLDMLWRDFLHRGKDGDFNFDAEEFPGMHGMKTRILQRSRFRTMTYDVDQREIRRNLADAAAQMASNM